MTAHAADNRLAITTSGRRWHVKNSQNCTMLSKETVRSLMVKAGLWIPRKQRAPKIQQPRYRRACCGELIQIDGCDHHWFENRAPACTALVYDATSRLMQLRFVKFEATRVYLEKHGKPLALYSDKASVFRINNKNATGGDGYTQFGRAMHELNIQISALIQALPKAAWNAPI